VIFSVASLFKPLKFARGFVVGCDLCVYCCLVS
jgi:hypothetical protein